MNKKIIIIDIISIFLDLFLMFLFGYQICDPMIETNKVLSCICLGCWGICLGLNISNLIHHHYFNAD